MVETTAEEACISTLSEGESAWYEIQKRGLVSPEKHNELEAAIVDTLRSASHRLDFDERVVFCSDFCGKANDWMLHKEIIAKNTGRPWDESRLLLPSPYAKSSMHEHELESKINHVRDKAEYVVQTVNVICAVGGVLGGGYGVESLTAFRPAVYAGAAVGALVGVVLGTLLGEKIADGLAALCTRNLQIDLAEVKHANDCAYLQSINEYIRTHS